MGWKTFKQAFGLERFQVSISDGKVVIGAGLIPDRASVDLTTGELTGNNSFDCIFLQQHCRALLQSTAEQRLAALHAEDIFDTAITVYSYENNKILEHQCEVLGWPNVTHQGELMYDNLHSPDKALVVSWAKRDTMRRLEAIEQGFEDVKLRLARLEQAKTEAAGWAKDLDSCYPDIPPAE